MKVQNSSCLALILSVCGMSAAGASTPLITAHDYALIRNDEIVASVLKATSSKYDVSCTPRTFNEKNVQWRCLNGPSCGYTATVSCLDSSDKVAMTVVIDGLISRGMNSVFNITFNEEN